MSLKKRALSILIAAITTGSVMSLAEAEDNGSAPNEPRNSILNYVPVILSANPVNPNVAPPVELPPVEPPPVIDTSPFSDSSVLRIVITDVTRNYGSGKYNLKNRITFTNTTSSQLTMTNVQLTLYSHGDLLTQANCQVVELVDEDGDFTCSKSGTVFEPAQYRINVGVDFASILAPGESTTSTSSWHTESSYGYKMKVVIDYKGSGTQHNVYAYAEE